jgi:serine/threonine protein kinase
VEFFRYQQGISKESKTCFLIALYSNDLTSILPKPSIRLVLCKQLLQAVVCLHENSIIHRDIKPSNILLQCVNPLHIQLADFGLSKIIQDTTQTLTGTGRYMALEMRLGHAYTKKVDIYAVGMTLYKALSRLMSSTSSIIVFQREVQKQLRERFVRTDAYHLLSKMLCEDPAQRLTATECLGDPYITTPPSKVTLVARFQAALAMNSSLEA